MSDDLRWGMDEEFSEWFEKNQTGLWHYAMQLTRDKDVAEDVVQDVAVRFYLMCRYGQIEDWSAYFKKCIRNAWFSRCRKKNPPTTDLSELIVNVKFDDLAEAVADRNELREQLDKCLGKLPEIQLRVFRWKHVDGILQTEIAKLEGVTPVAIHLRLKNALKSLRECLNSYVTGA